MGNLFTRALKRFSQCSSNRNQLPSGEQQDGSTSRQLEQEQREHKSRPIAQSIPVGQSIDSAEYAALESAKSSQAGLERRASEGESRRATVKTTIEEEEEEEAAEAAREGDAGTRLDQENAQAELADAQQGKPEVEEAVIKIQAFVRGHLTRKALRDAQQQAAALPPNALGQSHFDQESLMKSPPSSVFAMSAPPASAPADLSPDQMNWRGSSPGASRVPPLESIAEDVELSGRPAGDQGQQRPRHKLSPISRSLAISGEGRAESVSPAASEANASIDLNCDAPASASASASIDILDHNIRPADALAAVLHPKTAPEPSAATHGDGAAGSWPRMVVEPPASQQQSMQGAHCNSRAAQQQTLHQSSTLAGAQNSHSIDSAEAAAIRIQSAYRGYHTRKHSPYRRRSPGGAGGLASSSPASLDEGGALSNGQAARTSPLRQQNATAALDELIDEELERDATSVQEEQQQQRLARLQEASVPACAATRRASRPRHRLDTDDSLKSDSAGSQGAALEGITSTASATLDGPSNETALSTVALDSADASTQAKRLSHQPAASLTRADESWLAGSAQPSNEDVKISIDQNLSLEMDTESSNLGAALSMCEDISEKEADASTRQHATSPDERASEVQRFVDQLVNDEDEDEDEEENENENENEEEREMAAAPGADEEALERATDQLEAALEETFADDEGDRMAESLANAILDEDDQRTIELESDEIERRDPRGQRRQERTSSPAIRTQDSQPALVSSGSLDEEQHEQEQHQQQQQQQQQRLGVESPDEALESGRSSPALVSSSPGSSDEAEGEDEHENEVEVERKAAAGQTADKAGHSQPGAPTVNKSRKKNRNRKKGRK